MAIPLPPDLIEQVAQRAAELVGASALPADTGYIDVDGAAAFLACPKSRIYSLVSAKRIPFHKDGSRTLFDRAELRAFVEGGGARRP